MSQLLPPNSTPLERAVDATAAARLDGLPVIIRSLWNHATCPTDWLGVLAWALSVDNWRSDWPEATKRAVIAASPRVHRLKGTVAAVRAAIAPFGTAVIREWFDDPTGAMDPHTFAIVLAPRTDANAPATAVDDMVAAISNAKPLRSHFTVSQAVLLSGTLTMPGIVRIAAFGRVTAQGAV